LSKAVQLTNRTAVAIRKADALKTVLPGGKMRKGAPFMPGGRGGEYAGPFRVYEDGGKLMVDGGWCQVVNRFYEVEEPADFSLPELERWVCLEVELDEETGEIAAEILLMTPEAAQADIADYYGRVVLAICTVDDGELVITQQSYGLPFVSVLGEVQAIE
jgi:hypothetical protein